VLKASRPSHVRREPDNLTDRELAGRVYQRARCAGSRVDPDDWFPVARGVAKARDQAAHAIAVCARCPVRLDCLELSMRHALGIGAHGVWGGLVEEERRAIRRPWLAGTSVTEFLRDQPARLRRDRQLALHHGHPGRRRGGRPGRGRLVQRMHVPVELGGVIRHLDPDMPGVDLRFAVLASTAATKRDLASAIVPADVLTISARLSPAGKTGAFRGGQIAAAGRAGRRGQRGLGTASGGEGGSRRRPGSWQYLRAVRQPHGFPVNSVIRDAAALVYDDPPS
jgi:WhiB family redox-sensing transcriptional regulator